MRASRDIADLVAIMAALRDPVTGCPWDQAQTFASIAPYTIEEAYEVADAITRADREDLRDELGDLLLQVVFHARMAEEEGAFDFGGVVEAITGKMIRRHPHVFGDTDGLSVVDVNAQWERIKAWEQIERAARGGKTDEGALAGVPVGLPALTRALKLQQKAARVGFDWAEPGPILDKIREEAAEITEAAVNHDRAAVADEIGDLLFAVVNLARHYDVDPEGALRGTNEKFRRRFASIEAALAQSGRQPQDSTLAEMDALWDAAKRAERAG